MVRHRTTNGIGSRSQASSICRSALTCRRRSRPQRRGPTSNTAAANPSGDGNLQLLGPDGNPVGINNARGSALLNANARVTKNFTLAGERRISAFAEFYNVLNRANFGNNYGGNLASPATYNQPTGYLGGIGSTSTIPSSFQVQFGARLSF